MADIDKIKQPGVQNQKKQGGKGSASVARGDTSVYRGIANPNDKYVPPNHLGSTEQKFNVHGTNRPRGAERFPPIGQTDNPFNPRLGIDYEAQDRLGNTTKLQELVPLDDEIIADYKQHLLTPEQVAAFKREELAAQRPSRPMMSPERARQITAEARGTGTYPKGFNPLTEGWEVAAQRTGEVFKNLTDVPIRGVKAVGKNLGESAAQFDMDWDKGGLGYAIGKDLRGSYDAYGKALYEGAEGIRKGWEGFEEGLGVGFGGTGTPTKPLTPEQVTARRTDRALGGDLDTAAEEFDNLGATTGTVRGAPGVTKYVDERTGKVTYSDLGNYDDASRFEGDTGVYNLDAEGNRIERADQTGYGRDYAIDQTMDIGGRQYGVDAVDAAFGPSMRRTQAYNQDNAALNEIMSGPNQWVPTAQERKARMGDAGRFADKVRGAIGPRTMNDIRTRIGEQAIAEQEQAGSVKEMYTKGQTGQALAAAESEKAAAALAKANASAYDAQEKSRAAFAKIAGDIEIAAQGGYLTGDTLMKTLGDFSASDGYNAGIAAQLEEKGLALMDSRQRENYYAAKDARLTALLNQKKASGQGE